MYVSWIIFLSFGMTDSVICLNHLSVSDLGRSSGHSDGVFAYSEICEQWYE
jgi:hypothetical protein